MQILCLGEHALVEGEDTKFAIEQRQLPLLLQLPLLFLFFHIHVSVCWTLMTV